MSLYGFDKRIPEVFHQAIKFKGRYKLLYGGRAGMKSYYACLEIAYRILKERNHNILCVRQVEADCKESQYEQLKKVFIDIGIDHLFDFMKSPMEIRSKEFNSRIIFRGLNDAKRIKSISGVTTVWIEELAELEDYDSFLYRGYASVIKLVEEGADEFKITKPLHQNANGSGHCAELRNNNQTNDKMNGK